MILVVDDEKSFPFEDVGKCAIYARSLAEGRRLLAETGELEELWLDHDLGGDDTIRPLVLELAEQAFHGSPKPIGLVVVCSLNPPGADWIASTLAPYYQVARCTDPTQLAERLGSTKATWY